MMRFVFDFQHICFIVRQATNSFFCLENISGELFQKKEEGDVTDSEKEGLDATEIKPNAFGWNEMSLLV